MRSVLRVFAVLLLCHSFIRPINAIVFGGSNLPLLGYDDPSCTKPQKPYTFQYQWEVDSYSQEYNLYIDCMQEYIDNAYNDIKRIKEKIQEAVDEAQSQY